MATMRRRILVAGILGAMAGFSRAGMPVPEITIRDLGSPSCGWPNSSYAGGINNRGQVVGGSGFCAFLWQNGTFTDLGVLPGWIGVNANDVNDRGQIVGTGSDWGGVLRAYLWEDGAMVELEAPAGSSGVSTINDRGEVVGHAFLEGYLPHTAALWKDGGFVDLGTLPGGSASFATDINERGQVVGASGVGPPAPYCMGHQHAFLWEDGTFLDLGAPPDLPCSRAYGINNHGQVVGDAWGDYGNRAVVWQHGTMTLLEGLPGSSGLCGAEKINDRGEIVGWAYHGGFRAVLWQDERVIDLGVLPGMDQCYAVDISNRGQIVGVCYSDLASRAVLWEVR